jgi:hypothetical protein
MCRTKELNPSNNNIALQINQGFSMWICKRQVDFLKDFPKYDCGNRYFICTVVLKK